MSERRVESALGRASASRERHDAGRDTVAGVTTFIVMSYIIFVNPAILGFAGVEGPRRKGCRSTASSRRPASSRA